MDGMMRKFPGAPELQYQSPNICDNIAIYRARHFGKSSLDFVRQFVNTKKYAWSAFSIPDSTRQTFQQREQKEDQISIPTGSFLISISGTSDQPEGYDWLLTDRGTKQQLSSQECRGVAESGGLGLTFPDRPLPHYMQGPWAVSKAGLLIVKITNLSSNVANINLLFQFAKKL